MQGGKGVDIAYRWLAPASFVLLLVSSAWQVAVTTGLYFPPSIYVVGLFLGMLPGQVMVVLGMSQLRSRKVLLGRLIGSLQRPALLAWLALFCLYAVYTYVRFHSITDSELRIPSANLDTGQCNYYGRGGEILESFPIARCPELQAPVTSVVAAMIGLFAFIHFLAFRYVLPTHAPFLFGGKNSDQ